VGLYDLLESGLLFGPEHLSDARHRATTNHGGVGLDSTTDLPHGKALCFQERLDPHQLIRVELQSVLQHPLQCAARAEIGCFVELSERDTELLPPDDPTSGDGAEGEHEDEHESSDEAWPFHRHPASSAMGRRASSNAYDSRATTIRIAMAIPVAMSALGHANWAIVRARPP
jgi:hypothetical protein